MELLDDIEVNEKDGRHYKRYIKTTGLLCAVLSIFAAVIMNSMSPHEFETKFGVPDGYGPPFMFTVIGIAVFLGIIAVYRGVRYYLWRKNQ